MTRLSEMASCATTTKLFQPVAGIHHKPNTLCIIGQAIRAVWIFEGGSLPAPYYANPLGINQT